jgi:hypothetical protein
MSSLEHQAELVQTMLESPTWPEKCCKTNDNTGSNDNDNIPRRFDWEKSNGLTQGSQGPTVLSTLAASTAITTGHFHITDYNLQVYAQCIAIKDKLCADQISHIKEFFD